MSTNVKSKIPSLIKSGKINVFVLFLIFAFIILILTKLSKNYTNTIAFNINKIHVPEEYIILNDSNVELKITLKAYGFKLLQYYFKKPSLTIDFANNIDRNDSAYIWSKNKAYSLISAQFDKQVDIVNIIPDTLFFRYDVNTIKKVPVILNQKIKFSPGFDLIDSVLISPDSVKLIGPNTLVTDINFVETDTLFLSDVKANIDKQINLQLPDHDINLKFSDTEIKVFATIEKFTEGKLKIPITVKNVPEGISFKYFPRAVTVSYYTSLSSFKGIDENDFSVVCDYDMITENQSFLIPEIIEKPQSVKNAKILNKRIDFIITE
jgi:hypothetical protein